MKRSFLTIALATILWPLSAAAQQAFTTAPVDVYAGPSSDYPRVASLPPNTSVHVDGCLADWAWCDVDFSGDRGWVYAADLAYSYENRRVVIIDNGPRLGLPVLSFSLNTYWESHYRDRPWFAQREDWQRRVAVQGDRGGPPPAGRAAARTSGATSQPGNVEPAPSARSERQPGETSQPPTESPSRPAEESQRRMTQPQTQTQTQQQMQARPQGQPGVSQSESGRPQSAPETDNAKRSKAPQPAESQREGQGKSGAQAPGPSAAPSASSAERGRPSTNAEERGTASEQRGAASRDDTGRDNGSRAEVQRGQRQDEQDRGASGNQGARPADTNGGG
jgi:uncharacterized protein YraI